MRAAEENGAVLHGGRASNVAPVPIRGIE